MKRVSFDFYNTTLHETHHDDDYDRSADMWTLWKRSRNEITDKQWRDIFIELNQYKMSEMVVHIESVQYTKIHF
jgi:hypothetical protein